MDAAALQQKPAGSTPCPYTIAQKRPLEENLGGQVLVSAIYFSQYT